jgi:hypothetical protein
MATSKDVSDLKGLFAHEEAAQDCCSCVRFCDVTAERYHVVRSITLEIPPSKAYIKAIREQKEGKYVL